MLSEPNTTFPWRFEVAERLIGPDDSGGFYGAALDVPAEGWTVQTAPGTGNWVSPTDVEPKTWVRAKPIPPAPYAVGEVMFYGGQEVTILAVAGLRYWVTWGSDWRRRDQVVLHGDLIPMRREPILSAADLRRFHAEGRHIEQVGLGGWVPFTGRISEDADWVVVDPETAGYRVLVLP